MFFLQKSQDGWAFIGSMMYILWSQLQSIKSSNCDSGPSEVLKIPWLWGWESSNVVGIIYSPRPPGLTCQNLGVLWSPLPRPRFRRPCDSHVSLLLLVHNLTKMFGHFIPNQGILVPQVFKVRSSWIYKFFLSKSSESENKASGSWLEAVLPPKLRL